MESNEVYSPGTTRILRFMMGFLMASAIILIEIGISSILINTNNHCIEVARSGRIAIDPTEVCDSEEMGYFLSALSGGPFAATRGEANQFSAWVVMILGYGFFGGLLAQFSTRMAGGIFLGFHVFATILISILAYLKTFVTLTG
ncbi:MAG: hypothetical protein IIC78_01020 [Chloroflexi bacterium]|nr:hypothetical protein [Chloroflexota bacterium]